jgi:hypothetical protein
MEGCYTLLSPFAMTSDQSRLGRCPECSEDISAAWLLIEYENDDGGTNL